MAWSFRRRVKIIPGVHLNFSRSGITTSIGVRGANITLGQKGTFLNTGIPGTGIYKRQKISSGENGHDIIDVIPVEPVEVVNRQLEGSIISVDPEEVTSQDMQGIKEAIISANKQRNELSKDIKKISFVLLFTQIKLVLSYMVLVGVFSKKIKDSILIDIQSQKNAIIELKTQKDNSYVNLEIDFDEEIRVNYEKVVESFRGLMASQKIWDIVRATSENRAVTRSAASTTVDRREVKYDLKSLPDIKSKHTAIYMQNSIGADLLTISEHTDPPVSAQADPPISE